MPEGDPDPRDLRVLIVDDNQDAAAMLSMLLELDGYQVDTAHNGLEAVQTATRVRYDAVLLDLSMPLMDGFQAAAVLRQLRPKPLLIACSAWDDAQTRRRTTELRFSAHLTKPVPFHVLKAALQSARESHSGHGRSHGSETRRTSPMVQNRCGL